MKTFYVSVVVYRPNATGFNIQNKIYTVDAVSEDEARGKTLTQYQEDFPGYVLSTMLSFEKEDASKNVWQQVVDEALVVAHIGIANNDATFDEAKKKLNDLICHSIDIDRYFLAEEKKEQLLKSEDSLGIWLWSELMDYIKSRDIPSDMQNKLFKIMERAKHVFDSSAQVQQPTITDEMIAAAEAVEDLYRRGTPETWKKVFLAMWREMPLAVQAQQEIEIRKALDDMVTLWFRTRESGCLPMEVVKAQIALRPLPPAPEGGDNG